MTSLASEIPNLLHLLTFNRLPQQQPDGDGRRKHPSKSRDGGGEERGGEKESRKPGSRVEIERGRGRGRGEERDEKQVLEISKTRRVDRQ